MPTVVLVDDDRNLIGVGAYCLSPRCGWRQKTKEGANVKEMTEQARLLLDAHMALHRTSAENDRDLEREREARLRDPEAWRYERQQRANRHHG